MFQNTPRQISTKFFGQKLTLENGLLAQQATASILATLGGTSVLCAVVVGGESRGDYFPLQVIYEERYYAAGKIKSSQWSKREARPSDNAILAGRMIDRSLRSLFDPDIRTEIQVIITVLSLDKVNSPDTLAVLAASTAMGMCDFRPKVSQFSTAQISKLEVPQEDIYINLNTSNQIYSFCQTFEKTAIKLGTPILLPKSILNDTCLYQAYLLINSQEGDLVQSPEEYINNNNHPGLKESLKRAVSKSIQLSHDLVNSPTIFNSQFIPENYNNYQLYKGPVASVRIGYTKKNVKINNIDNIDNETQLNSSIKIYEQVSNLAQLQGLNDTTIRLIQNFNQIQDQESIANINKILTQKSPQLGIYFKNLVESTKEKSNQKLRHNFVVNPSYEFLQDADLDIVISGNNDNIVMVECGANIVDESIIAEALKLSIDPIKQLINLQKDFCNLN